MMYIPKYKEISVDTMPVGFSGTIGGHVPHYILLTFEFSGLRCNTG